ncbi:MAG: DUF5714 domain-containing protein [Bacilli bacterium]|jgi:hypothetical protein|nr:DUF5714 domain-containing protein [Bacilli bacterium]
MDCAFEERCERIVAAVKEAKEKDPIKMFVRIAHMDFVRMHGPEHHVLDGACLLSAYHNAGGEIDLERGLRYLLEQGSAMPGAICGYWAVCGSTASVGAALSFIEGTGPLSAKDWGEHLKVSAQALGRMGAIGGPRCCKRDAFISLFTAAEYMNAHYPHKMDISVPVCGFYPNNRQCLNENCPFNPKGDKAKLPF